jgi:hypothetical protein
MLAKRIHIGMLFHHSITSQSQLIVGMSFQQIVRRLVGQPIQAADPLSSGSSRLKAGCSQDCLPHNPGH